MPIVKQNERRPVTSATRRHFEGLTLDIPDAVSINIYSGWYEDCDIKERHNREMDWVHTDGGADKPVIISEFGVGARDLARCKWSEDHNAKKA